MNRIRFGALSALFAALTCVSLTVIAQDSKGGGKGDEKKPPKEAPSKKSPVKPGQPLSQDLKKDKKTDPKDEKKDPNKEQDKTNPKVPDPERGKGEEEKRKDRPVGMNTPYGPLESPFVFPEGPFEGLEPYGYAYFAAAREGVNLRNAIKRDPSLMKDPLTVEALKNVSGPIQLSFADVTMPAPDRYQLGPGDKISVRYSSPTQEMEESSLVVDQLGNITVPVMGTRLTVRGMTLGQAQSAIEKEVRRGWKGAQVTLSLSELRTISVSIVGEVVAQGNYQLPSVMTLFNALYAAGGPTMNGSMRNIQLRRSNGKAVTIDLYAYLLKGDASQDVPLQPGDLILVPLASNRVAVKGEVSRAAVYEAKEGERVKDLVAFAGGAKPSAILDRVEVASVLAGVERELVNVNLKSADINQNPKLKDSDVVTLYSVREELQNIVTIEGAVDQPRAYQFSPGMTFADAIERARGLLKDAYGMRADIYRENEDKTYSLVQIDLQKALKREVDSNVPLKRGDTIRVYFSNEVSWLQDRIVELTGSVRKPGKYIRMNGMRVSDLILQGGGLLPEASMDTLFIFRKNADGSEGPLVQVDIRKAIAGDVSQNVELQDRDLVSVYSLQEAKFNPTREVTIRGAVLKSDTYPRSDNLTLRDLILLAGGLRPNAGTEVQISHARVPEGSAYESYNLIDIATGRVNPAIKDGDVVTIPEDGTLQEKPLTVEIKGRVKNPGVYAITSRGQTISDLIRRAGGLADGAWVEGAQFLRDPQFLTTDAEKRLSPRVQEILNTIQTQEYLRALAKSDIDKIRALTAQSGGGGLNIGALGALTGAGAVTPPVSSSDTSLIQKSLQQREVVTPARQLTYDEIIESGNIPIRLDLALKDTKSENNMILKDGDILMIPDKPTFVAIRGAVIAPSTMLFESGKTLQFYVDRCGGVTMDADSREILVIRSTGTITKARPSTKIFLGDTIFVPTKVMVAKLTDGRSGFEDFFKQLTNAGIIYAIVRSLTK